jgi:hypothetical protein
VLPAKVVTEEAPKLKSAQVIVPESKVTVPVPEFASKIALSSVPGVAPCKEAGLLPELFDQWFAWSDHDPVPPNQ